MADVTRISGVLFELITKIGPKAKSAITKIGGKTKPPAITCQTTQTLYMNLAYGDYYKNRGALSYFCRYALTTTIEIGDNDIFYVNGQCGVTQATSGYYFTGTGGGNIYRWVNGADGTDQSPSGYTIEGQCA